MNSRNERGVALILVVWVLFIAGTAAAFLVYRSELEWAAVANQETKLQGREAARVFLDELLQLLAVDPTETDNPQDEWYAKGRVEREAGGWKLLALIEDEGSKPNLNLLEEKGFQELLGEEPISPDSLLDWRDPDSEPRPAGAENPYYQAQNPAYRCRDGFFSDPLEICQVRQGKELYAVLAPQVTVYGRLNPNALNGGQFANLLLSSGFDPVWVERAQADFTAYRLKNRFNQVDDLLKLPAISIERRAQLKPLLQFEGNCNINMVSETGLRALLVQLGFPSDLAIVIAARRTEAPFSGITALESFFRGKKAGFRPADHFTVSSRIIRYRIWAERNGRRYYLEAVYQRRPAKQSGKWHLTPLAWREATGKEIAEIPKLKTED
jgi:type II secretory pathway component PulK